MVGTLPTETRMFAPPVYWECPVDSEIAALDIVAADILKLAEGVTTPILTVSKPVTVKVLVAEITQSHFFIT